MEHFTATVEFDVKDRDAADHLFTAFCRCIADHVKYQATLRGNVQMNLCVVNSKPDSSRPAA